MGRKKDYSHNTKIIEKIKLNIDKINNRIKELKSKEWRNIKKDVGKSACLKWKDKQRKILNDLKNLRLRAMKYIPDEKLSQATTISILKLIGIIDVKIRLYKGDWKEWEKREREPPSSGKIS